MILWFLDLGGDKLSFVNPQSHIFKSLYDSASIQLDSMLTVTCDDIITLNANVVGDTTGHSFLWEQMTGTPVIWLEPQSQTTVMFQQPATRDDKVFRFTLNKGSEIEKYKEIIVSAIPTDIIKTSVKNKSLSVVSKGPRFSSSIFAMVPSYQGTEAQIKNDNNRALLFDVSAYYNNTATLIENQFGSEFNVDSFYNPDISRKYILLKNAVLDRAYSLKLNNDFENVTVPAPGKNSREFTNIVELSITDEIINTSVKFSKSMSSILEEIERSIETLEAIEENSFSVNKTIVASISNVVEHIERSISGTPDSEDVLVTTVKTKSVSFSSILEVKEFQYSSLG